jgi:hypothetical protein
MRSTQYAKNQSSEYGMNRKQTLGRENTAASISN